ncbi:Small heat shock protein Ibp [Buchnera aphidicola (Eriosoma grossulariae)]|uniref:Hsp20 family protein n=1 Tax=Buchnera aphidicola TaxID=9 RepID=UPI0034644460
MSYRSFSLIPELSHNIFSDRFNQIDKMFSTITGEKPISDIPSYDLIQKNDNFYQLTISIPGYKEEELEISVHKNQLSIVGKKNTDNLNESKEQIKFLHQGLKKNNFSINFNLNYRIKVKEAELSRGLLNIQFEYHIPEEEKPKKIIIKDTNKKQKIIENNQ